MMSEEIGEAKAKKLLSRIARFVGLTLVEVPKDAWYEKHWCFSNGKSIYTNIYFSLEEMLKAMLGLEEFSRHPWNIGGEPWEKTRYSNPFYGMSLEELNIKLDLEEDKAK